MASLIPCRSESLLGAPCRLDICCSVLYKRTVKYDTGMRWIVMEKGSIDAYKGHANRFAPPLTGSFSGIDILR